MDTPNEKGELLPNAVSPTPEIKKARSFRFAKTAGSILAIWVLARFCLLPIFLPGFHHGHHHKGHGRHSRVSNCQQAEPLYPKSFDVSALVNDKDVQIRNWLSGAVKIPTEIFDVMGGVGEDPRWDVFYEFSDCKLESSN